VTPVSRPSASVRTVVAPEAREMSDDRLEHLLAQIPPRYSGSIRTARSTRWAVSSPNSPTRTSPSMKPTPFVDLGHPGRLGVAPQVVTDPLLPELGAVLAGDLSSIRTMLPMSSSSRGRTRVFAGSRAREILGDRYRRTGSGYQVAPQRGSRAARDAAAWLAPRPRVGGGFSAGGRTFWPCIADVSRASRVRSRRLSESS